MENLAIWLSAISAFFAAIAALANLGQARRASQGNEVNVYLAMVERYSTEEMRKALIALAHLWLDSNGNISSEEVKTWLNSEDLKRYSRVVNSYFINCARLYEAGLISRKLFRILIYYPGLNIFYQVSVPIGLMGNPHHNAGSYVPILKSVAKSHGNGKIYMMKTD